jgi:hypothetical protein
MVYSRKRYVLLNCLLNESIQIHVSLLVINTNQIGIHLVAMAWEKTWENKEQKTYPSSRDGRQLGLGFRA